MISKSPFILSDHNKTGLEKLARLVDDHFAPWADRILPVVFALTSFTASDDAGKLFKRAYGHFTELPAQEQSLQPMGGWDWLLLLFLLLSGLGWLAVQWPKVTHQRRISSLVEENEELESQTEGLLQDVIALKDGYTRSLGDALGFRKNKGGLERITIYSHDPKGYFVPFARDATNPNHDEINRPLYPADQGCIAKAWEEGRWFDNKFPDPKRARNDYIQYCAKHYNMTRDVTEGLSMKSRLYYGWSVRNVEDAKSIAVVIVESTSSDRWEEEFLNNFFEERKRYLRQLVDRLKPVLPQPSTAFEYSL